MNSQIKNASKTGITRVTTPSGRQITIMPIARRKELVEPYVRHEAQYCPEKLIRRCLCARLIMEVKSGGQNISFLLLESMRKNAVENLRKKDLWWVLLVAEGVFIGKRYFSPVSRQCFMARKAAEDDVPLGAAALIHDDRWGVMNQ